jgi:hypothetical protein
MGLNICVQGDKSGTAQVPKGSDLTFNINLLDDNGDPFNFSTDVTEVWLYTSTARSGAPSLKLSVTPVNAISGHGTVSFLAGVTGISIGSTYYGFARYTDGTSVVTGVTLATQDSNIQVHPVITPVADYGSACAVTVDLEAASVSLIDGGTGYTLNDVLTLDDVGGSSISDATFTVTGESGGVITSVAITTRGEYTGIVDGDSNANEPTGGTGTGAVINVRWRVKDVNLTNAGSGYIDAPTFSIANSTMVLTATINVLPRLLSSNSVQFAII